MRTGVREAVSTSIEQGQGAVYQRADARGEEDRSETNRAAEQPPCRQHGCLDAQPRHPHRPPEARVQSGHQAVARTGTESRTDVQPGRQGEEQHAAEEDEHLHDESVRGGQDRECHLHARAHEEDVRDGADPRTLAERDPQQQDEEPDDVRDPADPDAGLARESLREHRPRVEADSGAHHDRAAGAVEHEADEKLRDAKRHIRTVTPDWTDATSPIALSWPCGLPNQRSRPCRCARGVAHA